MNIGTKIKELRVSKGLTQTAVATSTGLSQGLICKIENNTVKINKKQLYSISRKLDIDPVQLVWSSLQVKKPRAIVREMVEGML